MKLIFNRLRLTGTPTGWKAAVTKQFSPPVQRGPWEKNKTKKATLKLQRGHSPVFWPKRRMPYVALSQVEAELRRLEDLGILVPVTYFTWAVLIVVTKKSNDAHRLCANYSIDLNVDGSERSIAHVFRTLTQAEKNFGKLNKMHWPSFFPSNGSTSFFTVGTSLSLWMDNKLLL